MRKHAKHTLAGIIQDDHMTAGRVVDTTAEMDAAFASRCDSRPSDGDFAARVCVSAGYLRDALSSLAAAPTSAAPSTTAPCFPLTD